MNEIFIRYLLTSITFSFIFLIFSKLKFIRDNIKCRNFFSILIIIMLLVPSVPIIFNSSYNINSEEITTSVQSANDSQSIKSNLDLNIRNNSKLSVINKYKNNISKVMNKNNSNKLNTITKVCSNIWAVGIILSLSVFALSLIAFRLKIKTSVKIQNEEIINLLDMVKSELKIHKKINIFLSNEVKTPCIFGLFKYSIYIPEDVFKNCTQLEMKHIIFHELIHYKRKDGILNLLLVLSLSIHWYNPIIWIFTKKYKELSECAVDACILENLGENESISYGTTLINLSKYLITGHSYCDLALCFENKKNLKWRIKMIKKFKAGYYKTSIAATALCLLISAAGFSVNAYAGNVINANNSYSESKDAEGAAAVNKGHEFLIDEDIKVYYSLEKVQKVVDYSFKVPNYVLPEGKYDIFQMDKINDKEYAVDIFYSYGQLWYNVIICQNNPIEALKKIEIFHGGEVFSKGVSAENKKINGIDGQVVTIKSSISDIDDFSEINKYFTWKNEGVYYSIKYYDYVEQNNTKSTVLDLSEDNIYSIASSLVDVDNNIKEKYKSSDTQEYDTECSVMDIYDRDDLKEAVKYLGYNPKLPLSFGDYKVRASSIGYIGEVVNKPKFNLLTFYDYDDISLTVTESKYSDDYDEISKNDYYIIKDDDNTILDKFKVNKVTINNIDVYEYYENSQEDNGNTIVFNWKENDLYYSLTVFDNSKNDNHHKIVQEFMNSKSV